MGMKEDIVSITMPGNALPVEYSPHQISRTRTRRGGERSLEREERDAGKRRHGDPRDSGSSILTTINGTHVSPEGFFRL